MNKHSTYYKSAFSLVKLLFAITIIGVFAFATSARAQMPTVTSPYATVDWATFGQYKAAYHVHTTNSDGGSTRAATIEDHYAKGYDILILTDHNFLTTAWDEPGYGRGVGEKRPGIGALTSERRAEIEAGEGRNGRGMIGIPFTNEQSVADHIITMWADFNNPARPALTAEQKMAEILGITEFLGGLSILNHPGRYTGGSNADLTAGAARSNSATRVKKYVDLFLSFPHSLVGMEIINKLDNESRADRILWDNILMQTVPKGKSVWGFSNDDTHGLSATGFNYNMMLLPELTAEATRKSLETGAFYAVTRVDRRLEVNHLDRNGEEMRASGNSSVAYLYTEMKAPSILSIVVKEGTITIEGTDYDYIGWVADGVEIARGNTINLTDHSDEVNSYIRAHVVGKGGVAFTQPFSVTKPTVLVRVNVAHRGASVVAPENTLAAYRAAIEAGADGAECDVYRSSDGVIFLSHDRSPKRTMGGSEGDLTQMTFAQIQQFDAGSWKGEQFKGEKVPSLDEYLKLLKGTTCHPVIEIKQEGIAADVLAVVRRNDMVAESTIISFSADTVREIRRLEPKICVAWLYSEDLRDKGTAEENADRLAELIVRRCRELDIAIIDLAHGLLSPKLVKLLNEAHIHVWAWTVNDEAAMRRYLDWGVVSITTDRPELMTKILEERKKAE
ncbi:MAG: hypothetical protein FWE95_01590 [Planctomycetaceae bacterium]|nr:hypothetical protein [Planctomycetaceae bacterium]